VGGNVGELVQKSRVIARSYGTKISAVCSFVSSQSMRVADGQTEYWDPEYCTTAALCGKKGGVKFWLSQFIHCYRDDEILTKHVYK